MQRHGAHKPPARPASCLEMIRLSHDPNTAPSLWLDSPWPGVSRTTQMPPASYNNKHYMYSI